ncbi:MAG: sulfatase-like hydrolase/transferase [Thermoanaerobaculia bacterium]|nr:sulfatase-like hydrolase/transferase [Thermoanaerobaculia bacterium]
MKKKRDEQPGVGDDALRESPKAGQRTRSDRDKDRSFWVDSLHLVVLCNFALAQPLFDLLGRKPEFFAVRRSEPIDLWILVITLGFLVPAPLVLLEGVASLVHRKARRALHGVMCTALIASILLPPLGSFGVGPWAESGVALGLGIGGAIALDRWRRARTLLTFMTPALVVFPAVFLLRPGVSKILQPEEVESRAPTDATTPIVLLIFDELPLVSLLSGPLEIDAANYPHFAALADRSTWYRRTAAISDYTVLSVPGILTGTLPDESYLPIARDYPQSLFTLVGESYSLNVSESVTQVCPATLCADNRPGSGWRGRLSSLAQDVGILYLHVLLPEAWADRLPPVNQNWMLFAGIDDWRSDWKRRQRGNRIEQVDRFVEGIGPSDDPVLHMLHVLLPHPPYSYLPSGQRYGPASHVIGLQNDVMPDDPLAVIRNQQLHLLQLGYVDRILGDIIQRLENVGLWDRAVVVVTADHGAVFRAGEHHRRLNHRNYAEIISVPLFIKAPGQTQGRLEERPTSLADVLPTIADLAGIDLPWQVTGSSLAQPPSADDGRLEFRLYREKKPELGRVKVADVVRNEDATLTALSRQFDESADGTRNLYRMGPGRELIGRRSSEFPIGPAAPFSYSPRIPPAALDLAPDDLFVPAHLSGRLVDGDVSTPVELAVTVNGWIAAVTRSWTFDPESWSAVVDPEMFRTGVNSVELFSIETDADGNPALMRRISPVGKQTVYGVVEVGLHSTESWDLGAIRWTDGDAKITVPVSRSRPPRGLHLTIAGCKPGGSRLRVHVENSLRLDTEVDSLGKGETWTTVVPLDGLEFGGDMTVGLESDSFVPSERSDTSADNRRLGVAILEFELLYENL